MMGVKGKEEKDNTSPCFQPYTKLWHPHKQVLAKYGTDFGGAARNHGSSFHVPLPRAGMCFLPKYKIYLLGQEGQRKW